MDGLGCFIVIGECSKSRKPKKSIITYYINELTIQYKAPATIPCESRKVEGLGYNK
jgi:hypothetical protein